ncbi:MAG: hypothetical protein QHH05_06535 [Syntrophomonadaceae bacterium]|nr:hypothetical protein [Syntrophomonadaceae bacterium]MDH7498085.1 hypothetical protein [Syntrophomonadaceae bacterium]
MKTRRIIDANLNRAREGVRVAEDVLRYGLDCRQLWLQLKQVRLALGQLQRELESRCQLVAARDVAGDVGEGLSLAQEASRVDLGSLVTANLKRAQEALRVLEEVTKLTAPDASGRCKALRYDLYRLEQAAVLVLRNAAGHDAEEE